MLAAIPTKFFHYTPQNEKNSAKPSRHAITKGLTLQKSPRKSPPNEILQTAGEVGLAPISGFFLLPICVHRHHLRTPALVFPCSLLPASLVGWPKTALEFRRAML